MGPVLSAVAASRAGFHPSARRINSRVGWGEVCCAGSTAAGRFHTPTARGFNRRAMPRSLGAGLSCSARRAGWARLNRST